MGWQRQAHGPSVQATLEQAAERIVGAPVVAHAAGRTDAGVHARAMPVHFDAEKRLDPQRMMAAINARLRPHPIAVINCQIARDDWHARFSCTGRAYAYRIINRRAPLTIDAGLAWRIARPLDAGAMHAAAQRLIGRHDFTTFRSAHCQSDSPVKTLDQLDVMRIGDDVLVHVAARSFLHHQVRSMVGCLAMVGDGRKTADDLAAALTAADRAALWYNAPPDGLSFAGATYPD